MVSATNAQIVLSLMLSRWSIHVFNSWFQEERNCRSVENQHARISIMNNYSHAKCLIANLLQLRTTRRKWSNELTLNEE